MKDFFYQLPDPPQEKAYSDSIVRMIDGLGFRYFWVTHGLAKRDEHFRPAEDCMTIRELMEHISQLCYMVDERLAGNAAAQRDASLLNIEAIRDYTLLRLETARNALLGKTLEDMLEINPEFWFMINGMLADALTHVGQIATYRRLNDNPMPPINYYRGIPPQA